MGLRPDALRGEPAPRWQICVSEETAFFTKRKQHLAPDGDRHTLLHGVVFFAAVLFGAGREIVLEMPAPPNTANVS
jgi:hypothetical protein